jgi:hypothetical protein
MGFLPNTRDGLSAPFPSPFLTGGDWKGTIGIGAAYTVGCTAFYYTGPVTYASVTSNAGVATVNASGVPLTVTGVAAGTATITTTITDTNTGLTATMVGTVTVQALGVAIGVSPTSFSPSGTAAQVVTQQCTPSGGTGYYEWSVASSDPAVATATVDDSGLVTITFVATGSATITVTVTDSATSPHTATASGALTVP